MKCIFVAVASGDTDWCHCHMGTLHTELSVIIRNMWWMRRITACNNDITCSRLEQLTILSFICSAACCYMQLSVLLQSTINKSLFILIWNKSWQISFLEPYKLDKIFHGIDMFQEHVEFNILHVFLAFVYFVSIYLVFLCWRTFVQL